MKMTKMNLQKVQDYLSGKLGEQESLDVQLFLADHMEDPAVVRLLDRQFDDSRSDADSKTVSALWNTRKRLGMDRPQRRRGWTWALAAAAIALLLALPAALQMGWRMHQAPETVAWNECNVPLAQTKSLTLPDGTVLTLNAGSRVTWPERFTGDTREIFVDGEVLAEVAKDREHPFIIHAGDADVRVYGTVFDLKAYREASMVEVMLREGSVSLDVPSADGRKEVMLTPGDLAQYDRKAGDVTLGQVSGYRGFADGGAFSFVNVPLRDIASDLERVFGKRIILEDESLADRRFLAFFTNGETLDQMLDLLEKNGNLKIQRLGESYIIENL